MTKYCVAYISFFENVLRQEIVIADNEFEAAIQHTELSVTDEDLENKTLKDLEELCFDSDSAISVIEV